MSYCITTLNGTIYIKNKGDAIRYSKDEEPYVREICRKILKGELEL